MWTRISEDNSHFIKQETAICQNHPNIETVRPDNKNHTLETIYQVENISLDGSITLSTNNLINVTSNVAGKRIVDKKKLKDEGWFIWI